MQDGLEAVKRIAHSHNTQCEQVQADKWLRPLFYLLYTDAFACGEDAGKWLFGTRSFIVLNNGRNLEKFAFDPHLREKMRLRYKIDSELAFGHVGGFNPQKNHKFVLDVFRAIIQEEPNAKCFFIGTGPLKNVIEKQSTDLKDNIIFVGNTDEVPAYLDMMDGMILPSLLKDYR
ncbi:MAG: glycosyltransferase [Blautia massiliensis (ex Durand et al. 2017)]|uniref:glycosyltransferase n=1 Tax=Blautia massiliensis (ex Durand et al. 2017) TaxID=1737424 RepID=UPI00399518F2